MSDVKPIWERVWVERNAFPEGISYSVPRHALRWVMQTHVIDDTHAAMMEELLSAARSLAHEVERLNDVIACCDAEIDSLHDRLLEKDKPNMVDLAEVHEAIQMAQAHPRIERKVDIALNSLEAIVKYLDDATEEYDGE